MKKRPVVPECSGCFKIEDDGVFCSAYIDPASRHRFCICPLKTTEIIEVEGKSNKKKVNPIKRSKRMAKGR